MNDFASTLRHLFRQFARRPGLTLAALLTLAVGIGANTAIWSLVEGVMFAPLPFRDSDRLVHLFRTQPKKGIRSNPSLELIEAWRDEARSLEQVEAYKLVHLHLTGGAEPAQVSGLLVSAGLLPFLGVDLERGRGFAPADSAPGAERVAILSHGAWLRRFGGDSDVLGQAIHVDGEPVTVVGVLPRRFPLITTARVPEVLMPAEDLRGTKSGASQAVARLAPGFDVDAATAELREIADRLAAADPARHGDWTAGVVSARDYLAGGLESSLLISQAAVGLVLLIVCVNLAGLALAQGEGRRHEMALRAALGASRRRLLAQLLGESVALAVLGGLLGWILAMWVLESLLALIPPTMSHLRDLDLDAMHFAFTFALSILTGLAFGLWPALRGSRSNAVATLGQDAAPGGGRRHAVWRQALVAFEVAVALVLLVGAVLLVLSFVRLDREDPGFLAEGLVTVRLDLPPQRYADATRQAAFYERLDESLQGIADNVTLASTLPPTGQIIVGYPAPAETPPTGDEPAQHLAHVEVFPRFFETMGIPLRRGRDFADSDREGSPAVVVVNESLAERLWPEEDPLGRRLRVAAEGEYTVIGVAADVPLMGPSAPIGRDVQLYFPYRQRPDSEMIVVARTESPSAVASMVKARIWSLDAEVPVLEVATAEELLASSSARPRMNALLMTVFAGAAAFLAAVGIAGVVLWAVDRRVREIGLRMALGARASDVVRQVVRGNALSIAAGLAAGLAGAWALARVLEDMVYEVGTREPGVFAVAALLMAAVAAAAAWIPARRAARIEPVVALRHD